MNLKVILIVLGTSVIAVHAQSPPPISLPPVEVHGTTPLSGTAVSRDQVPANMQITTGDAIVERGAQTLTDFLSRELAGVHTTHAQNNPFQPDVAYRGFVSSFLLGTPPGLSVFVGWCAGERTAGGPGQLGPDSE